jgi:hypothetical protein
MGGGFDWVGGLFGLPKHFNDDDAEAMEGLPIR